MNCDDFFTGANGAALVDPAEACAGGFSGMTAVSNEIGA